jgi:hypothetical protein
LLDKHFANTEAGGDWLRDQDLVLATSLTGNSDRRPALTYAGLVDVTDAVAEALERPVAEISMDMVYRRLCFVVGAMQRDPASDPVRYLAAEARDLGIIKRPRKSAGQQNPNPIAFRLT